MQLEPLLKIPLRLYNSTDAHEKWCLLLKRAEAIVAEDMEQQRRAARGMRLRERRFAPEAVGRMYANYCELINKMYDAYLKSVHLQRAPYILELISVFLKRVYELRAELELIIVNDYIYVDESLRQLHKTPFDIQIVVPYHIAMASRPESIEQLLQQMWAEAYRRKFPPTPEPSEHEIFDFEATDYGQQSKSKLLKEKSVAVVVMSEAFRNAVMIHKHERFRQWYRVDHAEKRKERKTYFAKAPKPLEVRHKAAELVKIIYREFMSIKRLRHKNAQIDILLGVIPDAFLHRMNYEEENNKLIEKRRQEREKIHEVYMRERERQNTRLLMLKKDDQIDDITDEIYVWFTEWYEGYGFFPQYPYEIEGGTLVVVRGDYPTIEEKLEADAKLLKATKGLTKEQIKKEQAKLLADQAKLAQAAKDAARKAADQLKKARMNPRTDPGYTVKQSKNKDEIAAILAKYRTSWSMFDKHPLEKNSDYVYGFMISILNEELMSKIHVDCRKYVDQLRRLDLKLLNKAQKKMFKQEELAWPKVKPRPKPKAPPVPKPFDVDDTLMKSIEKIFDLEIVSKPTKKLKDICGDFNYAAYDYSVRDPKVEYKNPGYGDIRRRLLLTCSFGTGFAPGAKRVKSVLLLGPERNGKSFLVDCVAGEINAVKIDISPEKFSSVVPKAAKLINKVVATARAFQPAVIFFKNIERAFAKKIPPDQKYLKATVMNALIGKIIKNISESDKIIFIATCSFPLLAKPKMMHNFHDCILVPVTDYDNLQYFFYHKLQAIRSMPRDYCVQPIAKLLAGYGFGRIFELFDKVMTPHRIVTLNVKGLSALEFLEPLLEAGLDPVTPDDFKVYTEFQLKHSHLKKVRMEYDIINASRAVAYEKIEKAERAKEMKAARAARKSRLKSRISKPPPPPAQ